MKTHEKRKLLGGRLKLFRIIRGLSQRDLSALTDVPDWRVCQFEKGYAAPKSQEAIRLAEALGVKVSVLLDASETASLEKLVREAVAP